MLLGEVGNFREEKRALQQYVSGCSLPSSYQKANVFFREIGDLLSLKSKQDPSSERDELHEEDL